MIADPGDIWAEACGHPNAELQPCYQRLALSRRCRGHPNHTVGVFIDIHTWQGGQLMKTEREKMLAGELYDPNDPELVIARERARNLCWAVRGSAESGHSRREILIRLFAKGGDTVQLEPPFYCDYGFNIELGQQVYFNFNCVVLDVCPVRIGAYTLFGPAVQIYTATHPLNAGFRRRREFGKSVTVGYDVWVGGGAIILPGVHIGSRTIIGAGSVVANDMPDDVLAVGNPCRIIRSLAE